MNSNWGQKDNHVCCYHILVKNLNKRDQSRLIGQKVSYRKKEKLIYFGSEDEEY